VPLLKVWKEMQETSVLPESWGGLRAYNINDYKTNMQQQLV
jgi:hypothetical protein